MTARKILVDNNGVPSEMYVTDQFGANQGTAALPSIAYFDDPDTGIWFPGANTMAFSTSGTERMRFDGNGNVVVGTEALATSASNGFLYIPSMAGAPSGTPTTYAGRAALAVDTTNNRMYAYDPVDATWLNLSGAAASVAGSDTQMQYNNNGNFGASSDLTWNNTTKVLNVNGRTDLKSFTELNSSPTISSNVLTLDLASSTIFRVSMDANITTLTITNVQASPKSHSFVLVLTADGNARTVNWPASFKWAGGAAPTLTSTNGKVDILTFVTVDGGSTWYGVVSGQNF